MLRPVVDSQKALSARVSIDRRAEVAMGGRDEKHVDDSFTTRRDRSDILADKPRGRRANRRAQAEG
jgi:hypothetical protein